MLFKCGWLFIKVSLRLHNRKVGCVFDVGSIGDAKNVWNLLLFAYFTIETFRRFIWRRLKSKNVQPSKRASDEWKPGWFLFRLIVWFWSAWEKSEQSADSFRLGAETVSQILNVDKRLWICIRFRCRCKTKSQNGKQNLTDKVHFLTLLITPTDETWMVSRGPSSA